VVGRTASTAGGSVAGGTDGRAGELAEIGHQMAVVVDVTGSMATSWSSLRQTYLDPLLSLCSGTGKAGAVAAQSTPGQPPAGPILQLQQQLQWTFVLIAFGAYPPFSDCSVQSSRWTSDVFTLASWLAALQPCDGAFGSAAMADALCLAHQVRRLPCRSVVRAVETADVRAGCGWRSGVAAEAASGQRPSCVHSDSLLPSQIRSLNDVNVQIWCW
jgi:hypothetical protein